MASHFFWKSVLADYHGLYKMVRDRDGGAAVNFKDTKEIQDRRDNATNEFMYMICAKMLHSELPCIEAMEKVRALFPEPQYLGIILAFDDILEVALTLEGTVTGEHGVGNLKREALARELDSVSIDLHSRIKQAWDPLGILNPGKALPRW